MGEADLNQLPPVLLLLIAVATAMGWVATGWVGPNARRPRSISAPVHLVYNVYERQSDAGASAFDATQMNI